jgi:hypothetical protein
MAADLSVSEANAVTRDVAIEMARAGQLYRARRTMDSLGTDDRVPVYAAIAVAYARQKDPVLGAKLFPNRDREP